MQRNMACCGRCRAAARQRLVLGDVQIERAMRVGGGDDAWPVGRRRCRLGHRGGVGHASDTRRAAAGEACGRRGGSRGLVCRWHGAVRLGRRRDLQRHRRVTVGSAAERAAGVAFVGRVRVAPYFARLHRTPYCYAWPRIIDLRGFFARPTPGTCGA